MRPLRFLRPGAPVILNPLARLIALLLVSLAPLPPAAADAAEPFFFIQLSDPQLGMFTANADFAQDAANFEFAVTAVNRLRPAFVIVTGDLVNRPGDPAQIAGYRRILGKIDPAIPVYNLAGNHDIGNTPTPATIAAYVQAFGPDHFTFQHAGLTGIVLNSTLIHSPAQAPELLAEQDRWLRTELQRARDGGARHIVVFQHHPWFLQNANEPDQYFNIPLARRAALLALFREFGVRYLFCGHYHRNAEATDGTLTAITTGPVGQPLGGAKSGLRVAIVRADTIEHRYYKLGELPVRIDVNPPAPKKDPAKSSPSP
ncbi:MAG: metallophosphoesterase [Lacunisphaera sp.]|nr:metallophosphoesterase [Lacunisphaera sp.]